MIDPSNLNLSDERTLDALIYNAGYGTPANVVVQLVCEIQKLKFTKICSNSSCERAGIPLPFTEFSKRKREKDGLHKKCNTCKKFAARKYYNANKDSLNESRRKRRPQQTEYERNKRHNNVQFKMSRNLRRRIRKIMEGKVKNVSAIRDLGCTMEEFKLHLESKFKPGMTWKNYGFYGWHIDHIIPLSNFDLTNKEEMKRACHYTNLQPLWAQENLSKSNKI